MRKVATHINPATGEPCSCGFDKFSEPIEQGLEKTAGSKLDWIRDREDKFFKTEEGQSAFKQLEVYVDRNEKLDPLAPWIWRELKKGRIQFRQPGNWSRSHLDHLADWFVSNSPTRRGVDIMQLTSDQALDKLKEWDEELQSKQVEEEAAGGTVVADVGDGWTIRQLTSAEEAKFEGDAMGHCVGGYGSAIERGDTLIYSLRDQNNQPHTTIEIEPAENEYNRKIKDAIDARNKAKNFIQNHEPSFYKLKQESSKDEVERKIEELAEEKNIDPDLLKSAYIEHFYGKEMDPLPPLSPDGGRVVQIQGKGNATPIQEYQEPVGEWLLGLASPPQCEKTINVLNVDDPRDIASFLYWIDPWYYDPYYDYEYQTVTPESWHDYFSMEYDNEDEVVNREPMTDEAWKFVVKDLIDHPDELPEVIDQIKASGTNELFDRLIKEVELYAQETAYPLFTNSYYDPNSGESIEDQWERTKEGQTINYVLGRNFANEQVSYRPRELTPNPMQNKLFGFGDPLNWQEKREELQKHLDATQSESTAPEHPARSELRKMVPWQDPTNIDYQEGRFGRRIRNWFKKRANILDPISDQLDPTVWDNAISPRPSLKPETGDWITRFITSALARHGYTHMEDWLSLILTGSLTTYQYSPISDCDISLFVDAEMFPEWSRAEMIGIMMDECDGVRVPGTSHPLQCYVVPQDFGKKDLYKPGLRSAYDISDRSWIVAPEKDRSHDVVREMNEAYTIALENCDKMEKLIRYEPFKAIQFYDQVHRRRKRDMEAGAGDYAPSNISYKMIAERGLEKQVHSLIKQYNID